MTKKTIEEALSMGRTKEAWEMIAQYEARCPKDPEVLIYKSIIAMMTESWDAARSLAGEAVRLLPYNADAHYNYAEAAEHTGDLNEAAEYYLRAGELADNGAEHSFDLDELASKADELLAALGRDPSYNNSIIMGFYLFMMSVHWEHRFSVFHISDEIAGDRYYDYRLLPPFFIAFAQNARGLIGRQQDGSAVFSCLEMQRITAETNNIELSVAEDSYIAIASDAGNVMHISEESGKEADIKMFDRIQFYDYRFPKGKYTVSSEGLMRFGTIVPIGHSDKRKKAVVSLFIDGLSEYVIKDRMKELMPNTYRFFSKGMICRNTYSSADWTLPGVMSAATGLSTANHRMIHPNRLRKPDVSTPMLAEYFSNEGYNTTKIGGNWRINPTYGYGRGFNRVLYQHQYKGFNPECKIAEAIEQLCSMSDTDQFIWLDIGDLHLVADEMDMGKCVTWLPVMDNGLFKESINSVKQEYDPIKVKYYEEKVRSVDRRLDALYRYLEDTYSDNEMIVAAFSDHGQGFLLQEEDEFHDAKRSNVALMVRGGGLTGESDEYISLCDYSEIVCKLAGIPYDNEYTDSNLPVTFGGEREREFAITETIHAGDPYRIALHAKDYAFYLNAVEPVREDCLVVLDEYTVKLVDQQGDPIDNDELKDALTKMCLDRIAPNLYYPKE